MKQHEQTRSLWLRRGILSLMAVFCIVLLSACGSGSGGSNTVHVYDNAGVLNQSQVQSEASTLPASIDIYTVNTFNGTKADFDQTTRNKLGNNPNLIVEAIDTVHHHMAIVRGSNVSLSSSQIQSAVNAFSSNYGNGDYTGATVASIDSMRNSLGGSGTGGGLGFLLIPILVIVGILLLFGVFMRRRFSGYRTSAPMGMPYQQPYNQPPYGQPYPPGYYPPGYNQGSGMNPWAAGGIGAAAGGLIGYELGKEAGENQGNQQGDGGWAGGSGDFGNNGGDSGGGGDFGGGAGGGDFGGGSGDFGGGGGGGDFGGGSSGDF